MTLIELVVVVGIVLILVALATSSFSSVVARAEEAKTQTAMRLLSAAIDAYEQGTGKRITLSRRASGAPPVEIGPEPPSAEQRRRGVQLYGMHRNGSHFLTTAELTRQLLTFKESADIIAKIDPSLLFAIRTDVFDRPPWVPIPATYNCEPDLNKVYGEARWNAARLCQPGDDPSNPNSNPYCLNTALLILDSWGQPIRARFILDHRLSSTAMVNFWRMSIPQPGREQVSIASWISLAILMALSLDSRSISISDKAPPMGRSDS